MRTRRFLRVAAVLYVVAWLVAAFVPLDPTDMDIFFWPSAREALAGHPLLVYHPAGQAVYPNANGPLGLVPLVVAGVPLRWLGWINSMELRRVLVFPIAALLILLLAREGVAAIERARGSSLEGGARLLAFGALALAPPVWQSVAGYGHIEQPIEMLCLLLAVRWSQAEREARAGAALGLAILARTSALLLLVPLALWSWRGARRHGAVEVALAALAVAGIGFLPFLAADRADVVHSLITYRAGLPVGAGSFWASLEGSALGALGQRWDGLLVGAAAVALSLWATRRNDPWAALLAAALAFPLCAKTVWPYYYFEIYILAVLWAASRSALTATAAPVVVVGLGLLAELASAPGQLRSIVVAEGLLAAAVLLCLALAATMVRPRPPLPSAAAAL